MLSKFLSWMGPLPDAKRIEGQEQIAKQYKIWRIRMFVGMYVGYVLFYLTRKNLTFAAPSLMNATGMTKYDYGILGTTLYITYGIGKFISGILADKCNIRSFMAIGLIGSSIISLCFGFISSIPLLTFFWGLNGGLQSMGFPPTAKGVVYWFSPNERSSKWALFSSSKTVGIALIGGIAPLFLFLGSWQAIFYIPGILGVIYGISMLFILKDKPSSVGLPPVEVYRNDNTAKREQKSGLSTWGILKKYVFVNPFVWYIGFASLSVYFIRLVALDWGHIFMIEKGIPKVQAAGLLTCMPLFGIIGGISCGWFADKFFKGRGAPITLIYLVCTIFSVWGMYHFINSESASWFIIATFLALVGFFIEGAQSVGCGALLTRVTLPESIGAAIGLVGVFEYLGAALSGIGGAILTEKLGWSGVFVFCGVSCVAAMLFIALTLKKERFAEK
ncbi:MFS transporter [Candidatus Endomicrobiellum devescovinae]|jgi:sugar phosphate permease|uniref:MFS transporter n=1 Tax=Candidatus Endomicrobiellum devescovinae TaxID=3242322 RepID=UPI00282B8561|nr:MFS transporter [Endomicrobium sp.]